MRPEHEPAENRQELPSRQERLWAPWRLGYIIGKTEPGSTPGRPLEFSPGADPDCFLCQAVADADDRQRLVVARGRHTLTLLNRYPYNNGHLLVASREHRGRLDELGDEVHLEAVQTVTRMIALLEQSLKAQGFNIGLNLGRPAGAGVPGHLHWHVVPRWNGDTNFMPVLSGLNVIPQSLDALWETLTEALAASES